MVETESAQVDETIVWRLHLASSRERVFDALTTDEGRAGFWAESTVERNGEIFFVFGKEEAGPCPILESVRPTRFSLTYFGNYVQFDLEPDGRGGTDLTLSTSGFTVEQRDHVLPGWLNVLFPLKGYLDFGIDLRNHDPKRNWIARYVDG